MQKQLKRFNFEMLYMKEILIILWRIIAKWKSYSFIFLKKKISVAFEWIIAKSKGVKEVQNGKKHWHDQGKVGSF